MGAPARRFSTITTQLAPESSGASEPARRKNDRQLEIVASAAISDRSAVSQPEKANHSTTAANPDRTKTISHRRRRHCRSPYFSGPKCISISRMEPPIPAHQAHAIESRLARFSKRSPRTIREECETQNRPRRNCTAAHRECRPFNFKRSPKRRDHKIRSHQETSNGSQIRQSQICRLRLAAASGISALTELWPSG